MFLKLGPRRKEFSAVALIPNLLTTLALCSGLAALHFIMKPNYEKAMAAVVFAGVFDALDGRAARLLRVTSGFGAILDSLSDFLAFGVAPALILHRWMLAEQGVAGVAAVMTYALCAALRLARFTAAVPAAKGTGSAPEKHFTGMPSPAAAGAVLIPPFLEYSDLVSWRAPGWAVVALTLVIAVLMISRVPMFSLKSLRLGRRVVAPVLVATGLGVVGMMRDPWLTLAVLAGLYVVSIPVTAGIVWMRRGEPPAGEPGVLP